MVTTIGTSGTSVTFSGAHKSGTLSGGNTTTVLQIGSGGAADDVGRYVVWKRGGLTDNAQWEFRRIVAQTASTLTVHDPFTTTPGSGDSWVMSIGLSDIPGGNSLHTQTGDRSHFINGDFQLSNDCYLAMADENLECDLGSDTTVFQNSDDTCWTMGTLWGGEGSGATETTNGCGLTLTTSANNLFNLFGTSSAANTDAPLIGWFGSTITLVKEDALARGFCRLNGTNRMIGCSVHGDIGGRFLGVATEWVDCRMTGNETLQVAWSIGAQFTRPITNVLFAQGVAAGKNFSTFSGDFRDCTFAASMENVFRVEGATGSVIRFIDCTTFVDGDISDDNNGILRQLKSVNYTVTDAAGVAEQDAKVLIVDTNGTQQDGGVEQSNASGIVSEILTEFFTWTDASPSVDLTPFTIRIRQYGFVYQQFDSAISEPIRQEVRLRNNAVTVLSEAAATALTGIAIDFGAETVTVTGAHSLNDIYDHCQAQLYLDANMDEDEFLTSIDGSTFTFSPNWDLIVGSGGEISETAGTVVVSGTGSVIIATGASNSAVDNLTVTGNVNQNAAIDMSSVTISGNLTVNIAADTTLNFDSVTVSGDVTNAAGSNTLTINATGSSSLTTSEPGTGSGQVEILNTVTISITARDAETNAPIEGARVFLQTTEVQINELTNASGVVQKTDFNYTGDVAATGRVRKSSTPPLYKTGPLSGTITSSGLSLTAFLVSDE